MLLSKDWFKNYEDIFYSTLKTLSLPYNLIRTDKGLTIEVAVAGFTLDDIKVTANNFDLNISISNDNRVKQDNRVYMHKGISYRGYTLNFPIGDRYEVSEAKLEKGILIIDLVSVERSSTKLIPVTSK